MLYKRFAITIFIVFIFLIPFSSFAFQRVLSMKVDHGSGFTSTEDVTLHLKLIRHDIKHVHKMIVGFESDLSDGVWEKFHHQKSLLLNKGDGVYTIYASISDNAGNKSRIESTRVTLDKSAPEIVSVTINGGSIYSKNVLRNVTIVMEVKDAFEMQARNDSRFSNNSGWVPYQEQKGWTLSKGDGEKTVYVRFRDRAGNMTEVVSSSILLDATAPSGRVQINQDERITRSREVYLSIWADDDVKDIRISDGVNSKQLDFERGQRDAPMFYQWNFDSLDGNKIIRVFFRDAAGNVSKAPASDFIVVDTKPPATPRMAVNKGAEYTRNKDGQVRVFLATSDRITTGYQLLVSNSPTMGDAKKMPFINNFLWSIDASQDGEKTVYMKVSDAIGNESETVSDAIIFDRTAPIANSIVIDVGREHTSKKTVLLELSATDASTMIVSNDPDFKGGAVWEAYTGTKADWPLVRNGVNTVYAKFKDVAGNESSVISDIIIYDNAAPTASLTINNGGLFTNSTEVIVYSSHNSDAYEMMISDKSDFAGAQWERVKDEFAWSLSEGDGAKTIGAKFRDKAGNTSKVVLAKVILDKTPPTRGKILLNNGKVYNQKRRVRILIQAKDAVEMMFSENDDFTGATWQPYKTFIEEYLSLGDGEKTLYVRFKDRIGNVSESAYDDIIVDSKHPVAKSFQINGGAEFVNHPQKKVVLSIEAIDAVKMMLSIDSKFRGAKWEDFRTQIDDYELQGEDGEKTVYIMFQDRAGNLSSPLKAEITLDRKL